MSSVFYKLPDYVHKRDAWSIRLTVDPISIPLSIVLNKVSWISPNLITFSSFFTTLLSLYYFQLGTGYWLLGAAIWHFSNVLDSCDGKVARMRNACTNFGARLDSGLDKIKKILTLIVLSVAANDDYMLVIFFVALNYLLHYFPFKKNTAILDFFGKFGFKDLYDPLDFFLIVFVVGPIFNSF